MNQNDLFDITIIGAGPAGLFASFYAGMRQAKVKLIEALPILGGQVSLLYPEKTIYDIGGLPGIKGQDFIDGLEKQMRYFEPTICLNETVLMVDKQSDGTFVLTTSKGVHFSKTVIIASGNGAFEPRKLALPGSDQYEQTNLHYMVANKEQYKDATVVLCGGGDTAVDWALELEPIAKKVTLVHRRSTFRAVEYSVSRLKQSSVDILTPYIPAALHGSSNVLESVTFQETRGTKAQTLPVDFFIVNYGFHSSAALMQKWGLETAKQDIHVNARMETSIPGMYGIGDGVWYDGKIKLIATGMGDAPTAVNHAIHYLDPAKRLQPMQSTSLTFNKT